MAFQGIFLFALTAFGLASVLYYMYGSNEEQESTHNSGYSGNANDTVNLWCESSNQHIPPSISRTKRRSRRRQKSKSKIESECTVCLLQIIDKETILPCNHHFHTECIQNWKSQGPIDTRNTCPNCRKRYVNNN